MNQETTDIRVAPPCDENGKGLLTKRCSQCGKEKPLTEFYTRRKGDKLLPLAHCKQCHDDYARKKREEYRKAHPLPVYPVGYQRCCVCHEVKPYSEFHRNRSRKNGVHIECKACVRERERKKTPPKIFRGADGRLYIESRIGRASLYWTPDMLSVLRRYFPNTPNREIAEMLGVHYITVGVKAKELGLSKSAAYLSASGKKYGVLGAYAKRRNERLRKQQQ